MKNSNKRGASTDKSEISTPQRSSKRAKTSSQTPNASPNTGKRTGRRVVIPFGKTPANPLFKEIMDIKFNEDGLFILDFIDAKVAKLYDQVRVMSFDNSSVKVLRILIASMLPMNSFGVRSLSTNVDA